MSDREEGFGSKIVVALAIALGIVAVVVVAMYEGHSARTVNGDSSAPAFEIDKLGGGKIALADLKGKVVMLDFWATWCPPCREEIPSLVKLTKEYEGKGLTFVAASRDDPPDEKVTVALWVDKNLPALAPYVGFATDEMAQQYGIEALPTLYFIGKDGQIIDSYRGAMTESSLRSRIEDALEQAQ